MECKIPNLFKIMEERGITASVLSSELGISTGNISDWKSGRCSPSIDKLKQLSQFFNVSIDYLVYSEDEVPNGESFLNIMSISQKINQFDSNYLESTVNKRVIIISKYDESGNWTAFICKKINRKLMCGGHIGLRHSMSELFEWMNEMRVREIEVIVNEDWFLANKKEGCI